MSIVLAQTTSPTATFEILPLLFFTIGPVVSIAIGYCAGAFRRDALQSPDRIGPDEQPGTVGLLLLAALICWMLVPTAYEAYVKSPTTTQPVVFSPSQRIILSSLAPIVGSFVLLGGSFLYRREGLRRLGLSLDRLPKALPRAVAGIIFVLPIVAVVGIATELIWQRLGVQHPVKVEMLQYLDRSHAPSLRLLIVIAATVLAPFFEELLFRGHLQTLLRHLVRSPWLAIVLTSAAFALVHDPWTQPPIFALALCLGWLYERAGNLWLPMFVHALFNASSIAISLSTQ
jgi:membrane protease YdiL (CAAX protease family)